MDQEKIKKVPWGIFEALAVFLIFLLISFFAPEIKKVTDLIMGSFSLDLSLIDLFFIFSIFQFIIFIGYILLVVKGKYKLNFKIFMKRKYSLGEIGKYGLISSAVLFFSTMVISTLIFAMFPVQGEPQDILNIFGEAGNKWEMVAVFISAAVLAPISEELYFRGFLYKALRNKYSEGVGIAIASVIFASVHFDLYRFVPFFTAGIILNHIYEKYENILIPMIAHSVWNGIMVLALFSTMG